MNIFDKTSNPCPSALKLRDFTYNFTCNDYWQSSIAQPFSQSKKVQEIWKILTYLKFTDQYMFPPAPDKEDGKAGSTGLFAATDNIREVDVFFILVKLFSTVSSHLVYG